MRSLFLAALAAATLGLSQLANAGLLQNFVTDGTDPINVGFIQYTTFTPNSVADVSAFELTESNGLMIGLSDLTSIEGIINSVTGLFEEGQIGFRSPNFESLGYSWTRTYFFQTDPGTGDLINSALTIIPGDCTVDNGCRTEFASVRFFDLVPGQVAQVPAPATLLLFGLGLIAMGFRRKAS
jgi:hypothetical protein